jgi:hypothetical protein
MVAAGEIPARLRERNCHPGDRCFVLYWQAWRNRPENLLLIGLRESWPAPKVRDRQPASAAYGLGRTRRGARPVGSGEGTRQLLRRTIRGGKSADRRNSIGGLSEIARLSVLQGEFVG